MWRTAHASSFSLQLETANTHTHTVTPLTTTHNHNLNHLFPTTHFNHHNINHRSSLDALAADLSRAEEELKEVEGRLRELEGKNEAAAKQVCGFIPSVAHGLTCCGLLWRGVAWVCGCARWASK